MPVLVLWWASAEKTSTVVAPVYTYDSQTLGQTIPSSWKRTREGPGPCCVVSSSLAALQPWWVFLSIFVWAKKLSRFMYYGWTYLLQNVQRLWMSQDSPSWRLHFVQKCCADTAERLDSHNDDYKNQRKYHSVQAAFRGQSPQPVLHCKASCCAETFICVIFWEVQRENLYLRAIEDTLLANKNSEIQIHNVGTLIWTFSGLVNPRLQNFFNIYILALQLRQTII